jgi:glycosyltransferase involved in cell wall biosynthesis
VMSDDPAVRSVLPVGAISFVPFHDPGSLRKEILERLSSPNDLADQSRLARSSVLEKLGWENIVTEYLSLLSLEN